MSFAATHRCRVASPSSTSLSGAALRPLRSVTFDETALGSRLLAGEALSMIMGGRKATSDLVILRLFVGHDFKANEVGDAEGG